LVVLFDAGQARVIGKSVVVAPKDKDQKRADRETRRSIQMDKFRLPSRRFVYLEER
jgi:hypothetical protein